MIEVYFTIGRKNFTEAMTNVQLSEFNCEDLYFIGKERKKES